MMAQPGSPQVTESQLAEVFSDCGTVLDCRICGDPNSAMRFAFIEFEELEEAHKVRGVCNPCMLRVGVSCQWPTALQLCDSSFPHPIVAVCPLFV